MIVATQGKSLIDKPWRSYAHYDLPSVWLEETGEAMPFHSIIAAPEALVAISAAFDNAWFNINALTSIDPLSASAARERLGRITIGLWKADPQQDIAKAAVHLFFAEPDIVSAPLADPT